MNIGIYRDVPEKDYRAWPLVSQSALKAFADCPSKWRHAPKKEPTPAMRYGTLVDRMWLQGDVSMYAVQPATYIGKDRKKQDAEKPWNNNADFCKDWVEACETEGREVVSSEMWAMAKAACDRLNASSEIKEARAACDVQVAAVAEIEGVMVKTLIDLCPKDGIRAALADLKTAASADPTEWARYVFNNRLHWQAALELDVWNRATGEDLQDFFHIVSEQEAPHEPCMMALHRDFIALGRAQYRVALRRYAECREKDEWPGYASGAVIEPEPWMLKGRSE